MTQTEYKQKKRECWKEFIGTDGIPTERLRACLDFAFDRAYALGKQESKQESKQETVIQGWVARDEDGDLYIYRSKPFREESTSAGGFWSAYGASSALDNALFPSVTWESEALEVDITITPKHH